MVFLQPSPEIESHPPVLIRVASHVTGSQGLDPLHGTFPQYRLPKSQPLRPAHPFFQALRL